MSLSSLKVSHRLLLGFGALGMLVLLVGVMVWVSAAWQGQRLTDLQQGGAASVHHAAGLLEAAGKAYRGGLEMVLPPVAGERSARGATGHSAAGAVDDALAAFHAHLAASKAAPIASAARLREIEVAFGDFESALRHLADGGSSGAGAPAELLEAFYGEVQPLYVDALEPRLSEHAAAAQAALDHRMEAADTARRWSLLFLLGGLALLLAGVVGIATTSSRHVTGRLEGLITAARDAASGRLTTPLRVTTDDEFGDITEALNELVVTVSSATVSKTYVENIVQHMADPLLVVDPDVCISMVNQALLDLLGYDQAALVGASITRIFAYAGRSRGAAIKRDIERGLTRNVDSSFRTADGKKVPVSISCALVRSDGDVRGLVIVAKDITLQKQREQELIRARDEAERMVQLRDAFLANMSHEIRTPLTGILGSAQILAEAVEGEHRNLARIIEDAGTRLLDTINSVLEMARIEAGEVQPEMEVLDFAREAEAVANVLGPIARKKGLALTVQPPEEGCVAAQLDRGCLNRILNNLIGNAIKFTAEGGVSIEVYGLEDEAAITVRDTGIGISKEFLPQLFDDFKQESTGFKRSHEGSGLGLAITKKLVEMMGGTIHVESVKGLGSAFTIRFPRAPVDAVAVTTSPEPDYNDRVAFELRAEAPWETQAPSTPELVLTPPLPPEERVPRDVLLIEDNQQNAYMARFMLEEYSTDVANTPEEALELARRHQYAVLLVDINLGTDVSGIDLLKAIRKIKGYHRTQAVAVTAYALPGDRERFLNEGFNDYVSKPYRKEVLQRAIRRAMEAKEQPSGSLDEVFDSFKEAVGAVAAGSSGEQAPLSTGAAEPPASQPAPAPPMAETAEAAADEQLPSTGEQAYPTASPDEFLPTDFQPGIAVRPGAGAATAAVRRQDALDANLRKPKGGAGDGAGWPPGPPGR